MTSSELGIGKLSLKIVRQLKLIERYRAERAAFEDMRNVDPGAARSYNLYCKKVSDCKRRIIRYVDDL